MAPPRLMSSILLLLAFTPCSLEFHAGDTVVEDFIDVDEPGVAQIASKDKKSDNKELTFSTTELTDDQDLLSDGSGSGMDTASQQSQANYTVIPEPHTTTKSTQQTTQGKTSPLTQTSPTTTTKTEVTEPQPRLIEGFLGKTLTGGERDDDDDEEEDNEIDDTDFEISEGGDNEEEEDEDEGEESDDLHIVGSTNLPISKPESTGNHVAPSRGQSPVSPVWGRWSPWLQSGDVDIRFRPCIENCEPMGPGSQCGGSRVEVRSCPSPATLTKINVTMSPRCQGIDIQDVPNAEMTFGVSAEEEHCLYTLYDLRKKKAVFARWTLSRLANKGNMRQWCNKPDNYLILHTPLLSCDRDIQDLCKLFRGCKKNKQMRQQRNIGDFAHGCWKKFLYGDRIPAGLSDKDAKAYFICQRFATDSKFGAVFGHKRSFYGTIYDTNRRIPLVSLTRVVRLGDDSWPQTSFMIDNGLIQEESSFPWSSRRRQPGMVSLNDLKQCDLAWDCKYGVQQALPTDYHLSGYRTAFLMWPELVGSDVRARLSTFTLTNVAPMHPSLYSQWRKAVQEIRRYAIEDCGVPLDNVDKRRGQRQRKPSMYIAAGTVPSDDPIETIGNGVNVPFLFWIAGCCVRERELRSFAVYAKNSAESPVIGAPVLQLEVLLQDLYKTRQRQVSLKVFPGKHGRCGELRNDVSLTLHL